jgi:hypothetical protein
VDTDNNRGSFGKTSVKEFKDWTSSGESSAWHENSRAFNRYLMQPFLREKE